jgi:type IV pilus assembly protein PilO
VIMTMHDISLKPREQAKGPNAPALITPNGALVLEGTVKTYRDLDEEEQAAAAAAAEAAAKPAGRR